MTMWQFSTHSRLRLATAHLVLIEAFTKALEVSPVDFGISCGHRGEVAQNAAFISGASKLVFPNSKHNRNPAWAVDFFPFVAGQGVMWEDKKLFYLIAGLVMGIGQEMGYRLRWGGAWDGWLNRVGMLQDLPHIEMLSGVRL